MGGAVPRALRAPGFLGLCGNQAAGERPRGSPGPAVYEESGGPMACGAQTAPSAGAAGRVAAVAGASAPVGRGGAGAGRQPCFCRAGPRTSPHAQ